MRAGLGSKVRVSGFGQQQRANSQGLHAFAFFLCPVPLPKPAVAGNLFPCF